MPIYIDIIAFKDGYRGNPFTIPLPIRGIPDESINITAKLLKSTGTSVELSWSPPTGDRYKDKELEYQVHYSELRKIGIGYTGRRDCEYTH